MCGALLSDGKRTPNGTVWERLDGKPVSTGGRRLQSGAGIDIPPTPPGPLHTHMAAAVPVYSLHQTKPSALNLNYGKPTTPSSPPPPPREKCLPQWFGISNANDIPDKINQCVHSEVPTGILPQPLWHPPSPRPRYGEESTPSVLVTPYCYGAFGIWVETLLTSGSVAEDSASSPRSCF